MLVPDWLPGIHCPTATICLDDNRYLTDAQRLYDAALAAVEARVGRFGQPPRVIFCTRAQCAEAFGLHAATAKTVGRSGIVIGPNGWKGHYLRHEMIHHRQAEELGTLAMLGKPEWLIEGMAYALSDDPRHPLAPRWERARQRFETWRSVKARNRLWREARGVTSP